LQQGLIETYGSLDKIRQMGGAAGAELAAAWGDKNVAGLAHFKGLLDEFNLALGDQEADAARLDAAIQKYGFSIEELGPKMQQQRLHDMALELIEDWRVLVASGIDLATVNEKMSGSLVDFLNTAIQTGQEVPQEMQPMIEQFIKTGALMDENGNKITDMSQLGIKFSETMTQGFDRVVAKLEALIATLTGGAVDGFAQAGDAATAFGETTGGAFDAAGARVTLFGTGAAAVKADIAKPINIPVNFVGNAAGFAGGWSGGSIGGAAEDAFLQAHVSGIAIDGGRYVSERPGDAYGEAGAAWLNQNPGDSQRFEGAFGTRSQWEAEQSGSGGHVGAGGSGFRTDDRAMGGIIAARYFAMGNVVSFTPKGTDTVPAMLTPGEGVLSRRGMATFDALNQGRVEQNAALHAEVQGLRADLKSVLATQSRDRRALPQAMKIAVQDAMVYARRSA
jgi:hypothetical protein